MFLFSELGCFILSRPPKHNLGGWDSIILGDWDSA